MTGAPEDDGRWLVELRASMQSLQRDGASPALREAAGLFLAGLGALVQARETRDDAVMTKADEILRVAADRLFAGVAEAKDLGLDAPTIALVRRIAEVGRRALRP